MLCPKCNMNLPNNATYCPNCNNQFYIQYQQTNPNLMTCPACHSQISRLAKACPFCGNPNATKSANPIGLYVFAVLAFMINSSAYILGGFDYLLVGVIILFIVEICFWAYKGYLKAHPEIDTKVFKVIDTILSTIFLIALIIFILYIIVLKSG